MPGPGGMSLLDMMSDQPTQQSPPQNWPAAIGQVYNGADMTGGGPIDPRSGVTGGVGGNMTLDQFIQANKGPMGFFRFGDIANTPVGPPEQAPGMLDTQGRGPMNQLRAGWGRQEWIAGSPGGYKGDEWSTNNPNLLAAMGFRPSPYFPQSGYDYPYAVPPRQFGGGQNLGQWVMRSGTPIFIPGSEQWKGQTPQTSGNPVVGASYGFPVGVKNITGAAFPVTSYFWPGGQDFHNSRYTEIPNVT